MKMNSYKKKKKNIVAVNNNNVYRPKFNSPDYIIMNNFFI